MAHEKEWQEMDIETFRHINMSGIFVRGGSLTYFALALL